MGRTGIEPVTSARHGRPSGPCPPPDPVTELDVVLSREMRRTPRTAVTVMAFTVALVLVVSASAALPGKIVAHKSVSGAFAVTAVHATVAKPKGLWVRFVGKVTTGTAVVACSRGSSISSNPYSYQRAGVYRLPVKPAGADSCEVIASIGGSGQVTVEVRALR